MARKARKLDDSEIAQVEALAAYLTQEQIAFYCGRANSEAENDQSKD